MTGMPMRIDEARNDQLALTVDDLLVRMPGSNIRRRTDINDPVAGNRQSAILDNPSIGVDRDDRCVKQQQALHGVSLSLVRPGMACRVEPSPLLMFSVIIANNIVDNT